MRTTTGLRADPQVDYSPQGVAHIESQTKAFVQRCVDKMGKEFLANVGTANVAKDLDAMRAALGDDKLTYLGLLLRHPHRCGLRRGVPGQGARDDPRRRGRSQRRSDQGRHRPGGRVPEGVQRLRRRLRQGPRPARWAPIRPRRSRSTTTWSTRWWTSPLHTDDPRGLGYSDAIIGTIMALYSPNLWRHLTQALSEMADGRGDTMLALADLYMRRDAHGHYTNATDARIAVNCVDQPPITDREKVIEEDRRVREVAPFMSYGEFTGDAPLSTCAFWPVPPTSAPHQMSAPGLPPVLVVSTTNDPATPYQAGVDLAKQLGGALLTYDGTQHTVAFQGNACVDDTPPPT